MSIENNDCMIENIIIEQITILTPNDSICQKNLISASENDFLLGHCYKLYEQWTAE